MLSRRGFQEVPKKGFLGAKRLNLVKVRDGYELGFSHLLLLLGLGLGGLGGNDTASSGTTGSGGTTTTTATRGDGGELLGAFGNNLSEVLALKLGEELVNVGILSLNADCSRRVPWQYIKPNHSIFHAPSTGLFSQN
jgi:hypothetical protein